MAAFLFGHFQEHAPVRPGRSGERLIGLVCGMLLGIALAERLIDAGDAGRLRFGRAGLFAGLQEIDGGELFRVAGLLPRKLPQHRLRPALHPAGKMGVERAVRALARDQLQKLLRRQRRLAGLAGHGHIGSRDGLRVHHAAPYPLRLFFRKWLHAASLLRPIVCRRRAICLCSGVCCAHAQKIPRESVDFTRIYCRKTLYFRLLCAKIHLCEIFQAKKEGAPSMTQDKIRNIAIIAHVDHGKTTLVDQMLKQGGVYRENQAVVDRVMDSGDLERERGITILAKNTAVHYKGYKINIVDTPGHADFSGEVERILKMVDGVLLLVDAAEGPMPQTRFVLQKALELGHKVIVVVNKIDRPDARIHEVMDEVLELLLDLNATEEQFDSPTIFCSAREGTSSYGPDEKGTDLTPLFETIVNYIDPPTGDPNGPLQVLVSSIDYNEFVGRMGIGRIERGTIHQNQEVIVCDYHNPELKKKEKVVALYEFTGLGRSPIQEASAGEIVAFSGISDITIGRTLCDLETVEPLPFVKISDPTIEMTFSVNDSPFAGREGKYVTSRNLRDRLQRELLKDVSLHVTEMGTDAFNVAGRGEMHLSILIETMRREGYEFQVSTPHVLNKTIDGKLCEPIERMIADVPETSVGSVIDKISQRKGDLVSMTPVGSRMRLEFLVPTRGLFGYRNEFLTDTRGEGIMASTLDSYAPVKGEIARRLTGSLVAFETGESTAYGIGGVQDRGSMFIGPGVEVYAGMIVGQCNRNEDMTVNVCKKKQLTNMRAAGSDAAIRLVPPTVLSLEQCMEYLADDELLEVTPKSLRMRKRQLDHAARMRTLMKSRQ